MISSSKKENNIEAIIEGYLFLLGENGINFADMAKELNINDEELAQGLLNLNNIYQQKHHGIIIIIDELDNIKLIIKTKLYDNLGSLIKERIPRKLSVQALEVLLIIAYSSKNNKNIGASLNKINNIRGVNSIGTLTTLLNYKLIKKCKRDKNAPGEPIIYKITPNFYQHFKISSLDEMPDLDKNIQEKLQNKKNTNTI